MARAILVTGATGKQGGAVIDALLQQQQQQQQQADLTILAVTRNPSSPAAQRLAARAPNIRLVGGDLDDAGALLATAQTRAQAAGVGDGGRIWGVFSVQVALGPGVTLESEAAQGMALIDAAVQHGVRHFVYSSVDRGGDKASWDQPTDVPHFQSKHQVELYLRKQTAPGEAGEAMGWTVLRPVAYMDNLGPNMQTGVFIAAMRNFLQTKPMQWVAVADIGVFAAHAFAHPTAWHARAVGLAGDQLTMDQMHAAFVRATGAPPPESYWFLGSALTFFVREMGLMVRWFGEHGYRADVQACRREHPAMLTMEQWLRTKSGFSRADTPSTP